MEVKNNFIESINDLPLEEYRRNVLSFMKGEYETLSTAHKIQSIGRQSIIICRNTKESVTEYFLREFA
jgi:hypothetical protein